MCSIHRNAIIRNAPMKTTYHNVLEHGHSEGYKIARLTDLRNPVSNPCYAKIGIHASVFAPLPHL